MGRLLPAGTRPHHISTEKSTTIALAESRNAYQWRKRVGNLCGSTEICQRCEEMRGLRHLGEVLAQCSWVVGEEQ
jgi:hypothetical protein